MRTTLCVLLVDRRQRQSLSLLPPPSPFARACTVYTLYCEAVSSEQGTPQRTPDFDLWTHNEICTCRRQLLRLPRIIITSLVAPPSPHCCPFVARRALLRQQNPRAAQRRNQLVLRDSFMVASAASLLGRRLLTLSPRSTLPSSTALWGTLARPSLAHGCAALQTHFDSLAYGEKVRPEQGGKSQAWTSTVSFASARPFATYAPAGPPIMATAEQGSFELIRRVSLDYAPGMSVEKWTSKVTGLTVYWANFESE